ncbi:MAG: hypothetical protein ACR2PO_09390 [Methyloligellaceae bacterium]
MKTVKTGLRFDGGAWCSGSLTMQRRSAFTWIDATDKMHRVVSTAIRDGII